MSKIRSVTIDGVKTSLYTVGSHFHAIEHNKNNRRLFWRNSFLTMILPVLVALAAFSIDYAFVKVLTNTSPSILGVFITLAFSVFIVIQLIPLAFILFEGYIVEFFGEIFCLFTPQGRFSLYAGWGKSNTLSRHINNHLRNKEFYRDKQLMRYYSCYNDPLRIEDSIVSFFSKVDDETLISFIKDCQKSENLLNKIKEAKKLLGKDSVDEFVHAELRSFVQSSQKELDQVDARCRDFIDKADDFKKTEKTNMINSKALELLVS